MGVGDVNVEGLRLFVLAAAVCVVRGHLTRSWSRMLGLLDQAAVRVTSRGEVFFRNGTGREDVFLAAIEAFEDCTRSVALVDHADNWSSTDGVDYNEITFHSPVAHFLPRESQTMVARAQIVFPSGFNPETWTGPWAIILPATGDEGFTLRRKYLATPLALEHGVASILIQLPFYGHRRVSDQSSSALLTLEHMATQSLAAVSEAHALACWVRSLHPSAAIAFTGISFGGAMASLVSTVAKMDHACVHLVGTDSPHDAYVSGVMSRNVVCTEDADRLLREMSVARSASAGSKVRRVYHQISAEHDHYIPLERAQRLYEAMRALPGHVVAPKLTVWPGGHASAIVTGSGGLVRAVAAGLRDLSAQ